MKVNFKQPKYVIPLVILPFLFLGFYLYQDTFAKEPEVVVGEDTFQENIADVSPEVKGAELTDKLAAFQNRYKEADGYTAITGLGHEEEELAPYENLYSEREKARLDSMNEAFDRKLAQSMQHPSGTGSSGAQLFSEQDRALLALLNNNNSQSQQQPAQTDDGYDPMEMMKQQYALMDSLQKAGDPEYQAKLEKEAMQRAMEEERERRRLRKMTVQRASITKGAFNTVMRGKDNDFIKAIIDEDITGYAGSRIRIRLLEDILVGQTLVKKGTYLYALINGFSDQRVTLVITSIMQGDKILPINLNVYDTDGMEGLYVPSSQFREFTKELGSSSMQGMNITQNPQSQSEFLMSGLQRAFQSTSQAIASAIRKNKANIKYNTYIYLIDSQELQNSQNQQNQ